MNHLHIFQRIFFTVLAAMTIMLFPYAAFAAETTQEEESEQLEQTETVYFYDEGTVLTDNAFQDTLDILEDTASQTEMYIGVWLGSRYRSEYSTENLCDDTYDEIFGTDTDGVFLYLDCSDSNDLYDYISTSGLGQFYYSNDSSYDRISAIFEEMDPYLVRGQEDLFGAIQVFCDNLIRYKDAGAPSSTYYIYDTATGMYYYLENSEIVASTTLPANYRLHDTLTLLPGCLLIGLVVGVVVLLSLRGFYRFKRGKSVNQYLQNSDIRFTRRVDQFIGQHITRTRINNGSNGGHGGGSHGGGGLSHGGHGGSGHHR